MKLYDDINSVVKHARAMQIVDGFSCLARSCLHAVIIAMSVLFTALPVTGEGPPAADFLKADILRQGERLYRKGILPSGKELKISSRGGAPVDSSELPCTMCHQRAGFGSLMNGVFTPPINGGSLFKPADRPVSSSEGVVLGGITGTGTTIFHRPAYTRESLETALRIGIDPTGRTFNNIMPRYPLSYLDMSILVTYLESLSTDYSPGASAEAFKFATIITDDVNDADRKALLTPLKRFIAEQNQQADMYREFKKVGFTPTGDMKNAFRRATLSIWELKGQPETWPRQMAEFYAKEPVFAVLGGISNNDWKPIHDFCEFQQLPCLFPITDFPVISENSWYTFYLSKGYYQEGEGAARFLNRSEGLAADTRIVQIVQDSPAGLALAAGFRETWRTLNLRPVKTITFNKNQLLDQDVLAKALKEHNPGVLLLWTDADLVPKLQYLVTQLPPLSRIFMSSSYLGKQTVTVPDAVRAQVFITFPYRLTPYVGNKQGPDAKVPILMTAEKLGDRRIESRTGAALSQVTSQALSKLSDKLYRDYLLDIMGTMMDQVVFDYEFLRFGPDQRYASRGCYILQLGKGPSPELVPKSEWITP